MLQTAGGNMRVRLTLQASDYLSGANWTNVGPAVEWECPAAPDKAFFRLLGAPND